MAGQSSVPPGTVLETLGHGLAGLGGLFGAPSLRIGVTGLSRAGKTVFITGLVHALVSGARLPGFGPRAEGRIREAKLVPHPDDALPRFAYEDHLATLTGPERDWPTSTRQISALSVELSYQSRKAWLGGLIGPAGVISTGASTLRLDIVDYPGEWLLDLPLLGQDYWKWSAETLAKARKGVREPLFTAYRAALAEIDPLAEVSEATARRLAATFTEALRACRAEGRGLSALAPGRFLMPGDLEGAPALTFAPLEALDGEPPSGSLAGLMIRRFEAYKAKVVRPFFVDHFSRLDRQVVLVDVLGALNGGPEAVADLEAALSDVLSAFRVGGNSLLSSLFSPRASRVLFAATKADHLHHTSHDRLEAILRMIVRRAWHRAEAAGAEVDVAAIAAIRATREVQVDRKGESLPAIAGIPMLGEKLGGEVFDGSREVAFFPGDLPAEPERVFSGDPVPLKFLAFRPPVFRAGEHLPGIRLDCALQELIGEDLA
ncbi:MAG: YcjX family protein [Beijerinckiaceae bacterium]|jgi:predicted YcjX-like family ATPase|nr:YcjX family protein [Beijerinckiaceae bacterium]